MTSGTFKAAMIQMRSGLTPGANVNSAARMIGEAKNAGADYVLTPEMTNILAANRKQLFATIVEEDQDPSLATFRELAQPSSSPNQTATSPPTTTGRPPVSTTTTCSPRVWPGAGTRRSPGNSSSSPSTGSYRTPGASTHSRIV